MEDGYEPQGLLLHTTMAFTQKGLPLGLVDHHVWVREAEDKKPSRGYARNMLPISEKESFKWIRGGLRSASPFKDRLPVTMVADREADIFELFEEGLGEGVDLVVRLQHDRTLLEEEWGYARISERLAEEKTCGPR